MGRKHTCCQVVPCIFLCVYALLTYIAFMLQYGPASLDYLSGHLGSTALRSAYPGSSITEKVNPLPFFIVMQILCALTIICLAQVTFTDPGRVPNGFPWGAKIKRSAQGRVINSTRIPSKSGMPVSDYLFLERKDGPHGTDYRVCAKDNWGGCDCYKPDRTHHCRQLGRCVLEMDHYCPYLLNVVGYYNRKAFFLGLIFGTATTWLFLLGTRTLFVRCTHSLVTIGDVFLVFAWPMTVVICLLVTPFTVFHFYLNTSGYTTIEFMEKRRVAEGKRHWLSLREVYSSSLYDKGLYGNLQHVLGPNPLFWLVPWSPAHTLEDDEGGTQFVPRDDLFLAYLEKAKKNPKMFSYTGCMPVPKAAGSSSFSSINDIEKAVREKSA